MGRSVSGWVTELTVREAGRLRVGWCLEEVTNKVTATWPINAGGQPRVSLRWGRRGRYLATLWVRPDFGRHDYRPARDAMATGPGPDSVRWVVVWHTYGRGGVGGENASAPSLCAALEDVLVALLRQGFIPDLTAAEVQQLMSATHYLAKEWLAERCLSGIRWTYD